MPASRSFLCGKKPCLADGGHSYLALPSRVLHTTGTITELHVSVSSVLVEDDVAQCRPTESDSAA